MRPLPWSKSALLRSKPAVHNRTTLNSLAADTIVGIDFGKIKTVVVRYQNQHSQVMTDRRGPNGSSCIDARQEPQICE
jgi:hypothetical protein